jgi:precorrin-6A/cobalt-precorrin-6A reductase
MNPMKIELRRCEINHKRLLILGGTGDSKALAVQAAGIPGLEVISSLAGRTHQPDVPSKNTRIGGFGGIAGLVDYLHQQRIDLLIDATHPFAAQISWNAAAAAKAADIPHLMLVRPAWEQKTGDRWIEVPNNEAAAAALPGLASRIFLTIGRQELSSFAHLQDLWFLMRMIDPPSPDSALPPGKLLLDRGPFSLDDERSLLQTYQISVTVSKNSGGNATYAKIIAARELNIPVVMVQRPAMPDCEQAMTLPACLAWISEQLDKSG